MLEGNIAIVHHILSIFSKSWQMVKNMCPTRTVNYVRNNRILAGYTQKVEYMAAIII